MDIKNAVTSETVTTPSTLIGHVFFFMNMWAELDMARMDGDMSYEEQSKVFSAMIKPVVTQWATSLHLIDDDMMQEIAKAEQDIRQATAKVLLPSF
jgi:ppGpp synthetase/RelA/SpoT-type nucleotidyltranferase